MVDVTRLPSLIRPFQGYLMKREETVAAETSADDNLPFMNSVFTLNVEANARTFYKNDLSSRRKK